MDYKIIEKAWRVNKDKFATKWDRIDNIYYGTRGKARRDALLDSEDAILMNGGKATFLAFPMLRAFEYDKTIYNGDVIYMYEVYNKERGIKKYGKDS